MSRGIELPLQVSNHTTERFRGSHQQRIVGRVRPVRGKHLSSLGHSKLLPQGTS
jgi:hypothetical protein